MIAYILSVTEAQETDMAYSKSQMYMIAQAMPQRMSLTDSLQTVRNGKKIQRAVKLLS